MKVAVYTSITAAKDLLKEPRDRAEADLVIFSDQVREQPGWDVRSACDFFTNPRRNARAHKILAHQYLSNYYDYSLWIDGSIRLLVPVRELIDEYLIKSDIAIFRHSVRDCIYDEAAVCTEYNLDDHGIIAAQMAKYTWEGYPAKRSQ